MSVLSRVSYLLVGLILIVAVAAATMLLDWGVAGQIGTLVLVAVLMIYWVAVRRGAVTPIDPEKKLRRARGAGRPVVVYFYSDYHLGSLLRRPLDGKLEKLYRGRCEFIYISAFHPEADRMMESLRASVGDWVYFDNAGKLASNSPRLSDEQMQRFLETAP